MTVVWNNPPGPGKGPRIETNPRSQKYNAILAELQERPGEWATVMSGHQGNGPVKVLRDRGCDAHCRGVGNGRFDIIARWPNEDQLIDRVNRFAAEMGKPSPIIRTVVDGAVTYSLEPSFAVALANNPGVWK
jgi:hypothetical protein